VPDYTEKELTDEELAALLGQANGYTERPASPEEVAAAGVPQPLPKPKKRQPVLGLPFMEKPSAPLDTFALRGAEAVPAGGMLTDLIGTGILQAAKKLGMGAPGAVIPPKAQADLYRLASQEGLSPAEAEAQIRDPGNPIGNATDTYRLLRDTRRADTQTLSKENPWSGRLGEGVGTIASILAPLPGFKAGSGAGTLGRVAAAAKTGAAYGALNGFTNGSSDLSRGDWQGTARDIVDNALGGAAFGGGLGLLTEGASRAWPAVKRYAIGKGKEVLSGGSDIAAVTRKPLRDDAVEEVLASGGIQPFETTPQTHQRVEQLSEDAGALLGSIIKELEARGVPGPEVEPLAQELLARYTREFNSSGSNKGPANVFRDEAANLRDISGGNQNLGLLQAEQVKRAMQRDAKFHRRQTSPNEESLQAASSLLRQAVEDTVERAGQTSADPRVQALAKDFVPAKQRAGRLLQAEEFVDRAAAKYNQKPLVGLMDRVVGASTGNPITAEAAATAASAARRRLPSALSRYSFDLAQAMQSGALTPAVSRAGSISYSSPTATDLETLAEYLLAAKKKERKK
jgi:hypothetical protein